MTGDDLSRLERHAERAEQNGDLDRGAIVREVIDALRPLLERPAWITLDEMVELTGIERRWFTDHKDGMGVPYYKVSPKFLHFDRAAFYRWMERQLVV